MTPDQAQRIHDAHQTAKGKPTPGEYMRYMDAKRVLSAAGWLTLTAGQRSFLASVRWPSGMGPDADAEPNPVAHARAFPTPTTEAA